MKSKALITTIYIIVATTLVRAQTTYVHYDRDENAAYYTHQVQPKETLYSISKLYGTDVNIVKQANRLATSELDIGQTLLIPFHNEILMYEQPSDKDYVKVLYTVRKKETVFRICRKYFMINMTAIKELNHLERNSLDIGQQLIIGYLANATAPNYTDKTPTVAPRLEITRGPAMIKQSNVEQHIETSLLAPQNDYLYSINEEKGAAFWDKTMTGLRGHYVLHRYAKRNTWIEVTNLMYGTSVQAKVIGNIPSSSYPNDVLVVLSPSIAKDLGALDARFYVKVRYLRAESTLTNSK